MQYYVVNRTEETEDPTHVAVEDCDRWLQNAPVPSTNLRYNGRRPHLHGDREGDYVKERIQLDRRLCHETGQAALLHPGSLPKLAAYPDRDFDYAHQNRRGHDPQGDAGYGRIVTDPRKNQLGLSYHPLSNRSDMVRADVQGAFVADYRRDSFKNDPTNQPLTGTGNRTSTWPQR